MSAITASRFRPFLRPAGEPACISLQFSYDAELVELLKGTLASLRDRARDPARRITNAGGWLPEHRCWFVEPTVWPQARAALEAHGHTIREPFGSAAPAAATEATIPPARTEAVPPERTCHQCGAVLRVRWVTLLDTVTSTSEPVLAAFCALGCLRLWLDQGAALLATVAERTAHPVAS